MIWFFDIDTSNIHPETRVWSAWTFYPGPVDDIWELPINIPLHRMDLVRVDRAFSNPRNFILIPLISLLNRFFHHGPQCIYRDPFAWSMSAKTLAVTLSLRRSLKVSSGRSSMIEG